MSSSTDPQGRGLRRALSLWQLVFYGLGVIVGAGIYVAIGTVVGRAGAAAPISFLLAGCVAAATGLCYAELAIRFPEASGAVSYVKHGFGSDRLAMLTGLAVAAAVAITAASIAAGAVQYVGVFLQAPPPLLIAALVSGFTVIASYGVRESVGLAAVLGAVETAGLAAAAVAGFLAAPEFDLSIMLPADLAAWRGVVAGAFIAFFAFIGFETLVNLAEEVTDVTRTLPRGIVGALVASVLLYVGVAMAVILAGVPVSGGNPLLGLFEGSAASIFAGVGTIAIANGVLIDIIMLARLFYGMAGLGQLPVILRRVHPRTQTPIVATVAAGALVLAIALLVAFEQLLVLTNVVTLGVFTLVDLALWRIRHVGSAPTHAFMTPRWLPAVAAALSFGLMLTEIAFLL
ncbi:MAG: APC family permease [Alphaproteobacteria bacterium]